MNSPLLRPFERGDYADFCEYWCRPDVAYYMPWAKRLDEPRSALVERIMGRSRPNEPGECHWLAISLDDHIIGEVMLHWRLSGQGEIGFSLHPNHQGQGIAFSASAEVVRIGFEEVGLPRISAVVDIANGPSWKLLERLGMAPADQDTLIESDWKWDGAKVFTVTASAWTRYSKPDHAG